MFNAQTAGISGAPLIGLAVLVVLALLAPGRAHAQAGQGQPPGAAQPAPGAAAMGEAYQPDARFLRQGPNRKTKQVISLSGVKSDAELQVVRSATEDVVLFVRLFGITGSNLGNAIPKGMTAEQAAEIKGARVTMKAFEDQSTPRGRSEMPFAPASGHLVHSMGQWAVESDTVLTVRADFRQTFVELKPVKDPLPRLLRLRFVRHEGRWLFDGAQEEGR